MDKPKIGIFGGSGLYSLFEEKVEKPMKGDVVDPSAPVSIGNIEGKLTAFMPRHGENHTLPPHKIPYKANVSAFKDLGVERIIAPCASGSLKPEVKPGDLVICDQLVNFTSGRDDTYFNGPEVAHVSFSEPYCPDLRKIAIEGCEKLGLHHHENGTVVAVNGPRFSTKAESRFFASNDWEVINMTQYPEAALAREKEMCYVCIALITDYDVGLEDLPGMAAVTADEVVKIFKENVENLKALLNEMVKDIPDEHTCNCDVALEKARI